MHTGSDIPGAIEVGNKINDIKGLIIIKGDKIGIETDYRDALPVNMYAVKREIFGASGYMLSYPGLTEYKTVIHLNI